MARASLSDLYARFVAASNEFRLRDPARSYKNIVGDLGEHFACEHFGLEKSSGTGCDAVHSSGSMVEIKTRTNQTGKVEIKSDAKAQILIVLLLHDDGEFEEIYRGSMRKFFNNAKFHARTNDYQMTLLNLRRLNPGNWEP